MGRKSKLTPERQEKIVSKRSSPLEFIRPIVIEHLDSVVVGISNVNRLHIRACRDIHRIVELTDAHSNTAGGSPFIKDLAVWSHPL